MALTNPLQKYFRQPKIYIKLPSKGLHYEQGVLTGDYNNVPIFAMTGMDEIIYKTPDALFSGEATIQVIQSCCPYITDASKIPSTDIEAFILAIRIATFGESLTIDKSCYNCGTDNTYEIGLNHLLDHYNTLTFENTIQVTDEISIRIRPLKYSEMNHYSVENFKLQKTLNQLDTVPQDEQQAYINQIYKDLAALQLDLFLTSIEAVRVDQETVVDKNMISQWLENSDRDLFANIKKLFEKNREDWAAPKQKVVCANCKSENEIDIVLDQSNFFA